MVSPGAIKRLSVSVMADATTVTQAEIDQIQTIVSSAVGIDQARGDQIQVAALPFDTTGLQEEKNAFAQAERRRQIVSYVEYGAAVFLGLAFLLIVWRLRVRQRKSKLAFEADLRALPLAETEEFLLAQEEESKNKKKNTVKSAEELERRRVKEAEEQNPPIRSREAAPLLKASMTEER